MTSLPFLIVSLFGLGRLRPASGTWGSLGATLALALVFPSVTLPIRVGITLLVFGIGWWAAQVQLARTREHDPGYIVIDEAVGMCITCLLLGSVWWHYAVAFFAFRFFDVAKLWPASHFDKQHTAFSVMFDDVIMAIPALGFVELLLWLLA